MRLRERRACLAAIATQWHAPLAAHTSAALCRPSVGRSRGGRNSGECDRASAVPVSPRSPRTAGAGWAGASGSHVSHPVAPVRALCRPQRRSRGGRMRSRERRACLAAIATQWHAPLAAHTSAARCGPPGPLSAALPPQPGRAESRRMRSREAAASAVPVSPRAPRTAGPALAAHT